MNQAAFNGYWEATAETGESDYMYIDSDTGRVVLKIHYNHGAFLMKLWFNHLSDNTFQARLNPESEAQEFQMEMVGEELKATHSDLNVPSAEFTPIEEGQASKDFRKDVAWANRTMDTVERNLAKKKK